MTAVTMDSYTRWGLAFLAMITAIVISFFPWRGVPTKPLGGARKRFAVGLLAIGACTFYLPMVTLNAPVLSKTQWSFLDIASAVHAGGLPVQGGHFDEALVEIACIYVLMLLALPAIFIPGAPTTLTFVSTLGFLASALAKFWHIGFLNTFGWNYWEPGRMKAGIAWWILPWIMPARWHCALPRAWM